MSHAIGDKVEDFELSDDKGQRHRLSEIVARGPAVLAFFPLAFTGVCTAEMCEFRDAIKDFEALKASVFGISVDSGPALGAFSKQQELNFPLLSDFNKEVSTSLDVLYADFGGMRGVAKRSVIVVGPDQTVAYAWVTDNAKDRPDLAPVQEALKQLA